MLIELLIGSIIIGIIRGGSIWRLMNTSFNRISVLILSLLIYISFFHFALRGYDIVLNHIEKVHVVVYIILIFGIILNYKFREVWIIFIGVIANLVSFFINSSRIVFSVEGLNYAGFNDIVRIITTESIDFLAPLTEMTKVGFLGRFIAIPPIYIYPQIFSIGDFVISLGIFLLIQNIMLNEDIGRNKMLKFRYKRR